MVISGKCYPNVTPKHLFYFEGLSYRQIARAMSGNQKYEINRDNVSYQIRSAKRRILQFYPKIKRDVSIYCIGRFVLYPIDFIQQNAEF